MSNFSELLAQSRNNSQRARFEALSRSAQMRSKQAEMLAQRQQHQDQMDAQNAQFMARLGFDREQMKAKLKEGQDNQKEREAAAALDRQNRIDVAKEQGGGRQAVATINTGARSADAGKKLSSEEDRFARGDETKRRGQDTVAESNKYKTDIGQENAQGHDKTALEVGKGHDTARIDTNERAVGQREAAEQDHVAQQILDRASRDFSAAQSNGTHRDIAAAHVKLREAEDHFHATQSLRKEMDNPLADPANVKLWQDEVSKYNGQESFSDALSQPQTPVARPTPRVNPGVEGEPGGAEGPKGTPIDVQDSARSLIAPKYKPAPSTLQTLKGLKGDERTKAIADYKASIPSATLDPNEVYQKSIEAGVPPAQAQARADKAVAQNAAVQGKRQEMIHRGEPTAPAEREELHRTMPTNKPWSLELQNETKYEPGSTLQSLIGRMGNATLGDIPLAGYIPKAIDAVAGTHTQDWSALPEGEDSYAPGAVLRNMARGAVLGGAGAAANVAAPYVAKGAGAAFDATLGKVPLLGTGLRKAGEVAAYTPNKISEAMDNGIAAIPGLSRQAGLGYGAAKGAAQNLENEALRGVASNTPEAFESSMLGKEVAPTTEIPAPPIEPPSAPQNQAGRNTGLDKYTSPDFEQWADKNVTADGTPGGLRAAVNEPTPFDDLPDLSNEVSSTSPTSGGISNRAVSPNAATTAPLPRPAETVVKTPNPEQNFSDLLKTPDATPPNYDPLQWERQKAWELYQRTGKHPNFKQTWDSEGNPVTNVPGEFEFD